MDSQSEGVPLTTNHTAELEEGALLYYPSANVDSHGSIEANDSTKGPNLMSQSSVLVSLSFSGKQEGPAE